MTSDKNMERVREFHDAFGVENRDRPHLTDAAIFTLRMRLLREELDELEEGFYDTERREVQVLDALCDLQYVLDGAFLALGFWPVKEAAIAEVHRSNMSKLGPDGKPIYRKDGKVLKSAGYTPPNLDQFVDQTATATTAVTQ